MSDGEERALVESVLGGGVLVEEKEAPDPELERLKTEARALRAAASKLKARLPERREQIPFAENAVRAAVRAAVASSGAVEALLVRAAELQAKLIGCRAALTAIVDNLPPMGVTSPRERPCCWAPVPFHVDHVEADRWRQSERASKNPRHNRRTANHPRREGGREVSHAQGDRDA